MTGNNNEIKNGMHEKNGVTQETGASPVDSAFVQITDIGSSTLPDNAYVEGYPVKQQVIAKQIKKINRKYLTQILLSLLRNILCWACLVCLIIMCSAGAVFKTWPTDSLVAVVVIFAMGLVGICFHVARAYFDLTFQHPTIVAQMLRDAIPRDEFVRKIQNRQLSAPEMFIEVSLKSGAISYEDPNHWTRIGRKTCKELPYRSWADQSPSVQQFKFPETGGCWILASKDYRCVDETSKMSMESAVAEFRRDTGYEANSYFMDLEYILQWKEADSCDDVEMYLIYDDARTSRSGFYSFDLYKASWIVALDSLYRIVFHFKTKRLEDYFIIKFIER